MIIKNMFKVTYAYFQFWKRVIFLSTETISSQYIYIYIYIGGRTGWVSFSTSQPEV